MSFLLQKGLMGDLIHKVLVSIWYCTFWLKLYLHVNVFVPLLVKPNEKLLILNLFKCLGLKFFFFFTLQE